MARGESWAAGEVSIGARHFHLNILQYQTLPYENLQEWDTDLKARNWIHFRDGFIESVKVLENITADEAVEKVNQMIAGKLPVEKVNQMIAGKLPVDKAYKYLQDLAKGNYVVDKTPPYSMDLKILSRAEIITKEPVYIYIYRHPLSVMGSLVSSRFDKMIGVKTDTRAGFLRSA